MVLLAVNPRTHFMPTRSPAPVGDVAREEGGHRVAERPVRSRVDADLRGQLRVARETAQGDLGEREAFGNDGMAALRPRPTGSGAAAGRSWPESSASAAAGLFARLWR